MVDGNEEENEGNDGNSTGMVDGDADNQDDDKQAEDRNALEEEKSDSGESTEGNMSQSKKGNQSDDQEGDAADTMHSIDKPLDAEIRITKVDIQGALDDN